MQFYSDLSTYKILRNCLRNLNNSAVPDSPSNLQLKRSVLLRLSELHVPELQTDREELPENLAPQTDPRR